MFVHAPAQMEPYIIAAFSSFLMALNLSLIFWKQEFCRIFYLVMLLSNMLEDRKKNGLKDYMRCRTDFFHDLALQKISSSPEKASRVFLTKSCSFSSFP